MKNRSAATLAFAALLLASTGGIAQSIASHNPSAVAPGAYKVEPYHTQVVFSLSHFGFTEFSGLFGGATGSLQLDPTDAANDKFNVSIAMNSVLTTSPKLDEELKGDKWFDAAQFPTATFVSTKVTPTGPDSATVYGDLTLHGVTHPITLLVHFVGAGVNPIDKSNTVGFSGTATIKRSDFGVKAYVPVVGDDVRLVIAGAFTRI